MFLGESPKGMFLYIGKVRFRVKVAERHASFLGNRQMACFFMWGKFKLRVRVAERHASFFRASPKGMLLYVGEI